MKLNLIFYEELLLTFTDLMNTYTNFDAFNVQTWICGVCQFINFTILCQQYFVHCILDISYQ